MKSKLKGLMIIVALGLVFGFGVSTTEAAEVSTEVELVPMSVAELTNLGIDCSGITEMCLENMTGSVDSNLTGTTTFFGYRFASDACVDTADLISAQISTTVSNATANMIDGNGVMLAVGDYDLGAPLTILTVNEGNLFNSIFSGPNMIARGFDASMLEAGEVPLLDEGILDAVYDLSGYTFADISDLITVVQHIQYDPLAAGVTTSLPTVTITYDDSACPPADTDGDGISDDQEMADGSDYMDACSPNPYALPDGDCDNDGLSNGQEDANSNGLYDQGTETDPTNPDTDGDGVVDGVDDYALDPCMPDATKCKDVTPLTTLPKAGIPVVIFSIVATAIILSVYKLRQHS
ncbi:hypothetical protein H6792_01225 [Candidatus Nomurabacteria bacterium]|nr:hypothetical protein [Candidatus Nomurabacteria bacterium]